MSDYAITFDLIDTDNDGRISADELVRLMEVLGRRITLEAAQEGCASSTRTATGYRRQRIRYVPPGLTLPADGAGEARTGGAGALAPADTARASSCAAADR